MSITRKTQALTNVVAGGSVSGDLALGLRYNSITLELTNCIPSDLENIQIRLNNKTFQEFSSGEVAASMNSYYQNDDGTGFLTFDFARPEMSNLLQRSHTGIDTGPRDKVKYPVEMFPNLLFAESFQILFDLKSSVINPRIVATADLVKSSGAGIGRIIKIKRNPVASATAGEVELSTILKSPAARAIHIKDTDATNNTFPTYVTVEKNGHKVFEAGRSLNNEILKKFHRTPQTDYFHIDFCKEGDFATALNTEEASDWRILATLPEAGAFEVIMEYVEPLNGK